MSSKRYRSTKTALVSAGEWFKDPDFPTDDRSIDNDPSKRSGIIWTRAKLLNRNAVFIEDGATRNDVDQGALGDCWFIAGVAVLATHHEAWLERVVPPDQSFKEPYTGLFRFNFWWYGKWTEVMVDDYLPTNRNNLVFCSNRERPNEFWPALLEKAYAKLHGSYGALNGGYLQDAMVDLTGGICEVINTGDHFNNQDNLYKFLMSSSKMNSMLGASINRREGATKSDEKMKNGLIMGHAYSITGFYQRKKRDGSYINLIRVRNPWGNVEWNGAWSDESKEFTNLEEADKRTMQYEKLNDGEFWMDFRDFIQNFHRIHLCHLHVDATSDQTGNNSTNKQAWNVTVCNHGWIRGIAAGGSPTPLNQNSTDQQYWKWNNPQFHISLKQPDTIHNQSGHCTVIISLMEKEYRNSKQGIAINFDLYKLERPDPRPLNGARASENARLVAKMEGSYRDYREVCQRFILHPGDYVIIAYTLHPHQEAKFMLRIFTENALENYNELNSPTFADLDAVVLRVVDSEEDSRRSACDNCAVL